ncbi:hypothetical protein Gohar_009387 [Gossypium harknessii]|uniref:Uncharacterized protein n=1 Tax=Gossypium harknessii TaxID=34285 RepID=A0A7J9GMN9_9ROSI|nr:hypothetical protein [Gossypium harknessii]
MNEGIDMVVDDEPKSTLSWKDKLLGNLASGSKELGTQIWFADDDKIELMDKDITRLVVNAIPVINFSERVNQILIKNMATTVVLINGHLHRVEFESLLVVCFGYG